MELKAVTLYDFLRAMEWAAARGRRMMIREIWYVYNSRYERERLIGEWYDFRYGDRQILS